MSHDRDPIRPAAAASSRFVGDLEPRGSPARMAAGSPSRTNATCLGGLKRISVQLGPALLLDDIVCVGNAVLYAGH